MASIVLLSNQSAKVRRNVLAALVALVAVAGAAACSRGSSEGMLQTGATAPDFTATDASGKPVKLSDAAGHERVVYFYPKDETPGCTKEACAFRDAFKSYTDRGIVLFGVSRDSEESHKKFRESHQLPFALVADESGEVQKAYGVPSKMAVLASRVTFLVDKEGKIEKVWPDVDPGVHAAEVLAAVK
jgi:peroxiredoxin Q/BCP